MKYLLLSSLLSLLSIGQLYAASNSREDAERAEQRERSEREAVTLAARYALVPSLQQQCTNVILRDMLGSDAVAPVAATAQDQDLERAEAQMARFAHAAGALYRGLRDHMEVDILLEGRSIDNRTQKDRIDLAAQKLTRGWNLLHQRHLHNQMQAMWEAQGNHEIVSTVARDLSMGMLAAVGSWAPRLLVAYIVNQRCNAMYEQYRGIWDPKLEEFLKEVPGATGEQILEFVAALIGDKPEFIQTMHEKAMCGKLRYAMPIALAGIGYLTAREGVKRDNRHLKDIGMTCKSRAIAELIILAASKMLPATIRLLGREALAQRVQTGAPFITMAIGAALTYGRNQRNDGLLTSAGFIALGECVLHLISLVKPF